MAFPTRFSEFPGVPGAGFIRCRWVGDRQADIYLIRAPEKRPSSPRVWGRGDGGDEGAYSSPVYERLG